MSDNSPPDAVSPVSAGRRLLKGWQIILIWTVGITAFGVLAFVLSGRMVLLRAKAEPQQPVEHVQMNSIIKPLAYPPEDDSPPQPPHTPPSRPAYTQTQKFRVAHMPGQGAPDERTRAINSPLKGYAAKINGGSAGDRVASMSGTETAPPGSPDALEASLKPTTIEGTKVAELPDPRWLIEQGRILPCVQQTKINSSLPGAVTAIIPEDVRGETGDVVLLDKGARVFGTIQHGLMHGIDRLFVLWQNITTPVLYDQRGMPHQFRVAVNSPAADQIGQTGLDGDVNHHYLKKIGGIIGMSLIQGGIQAGVSAASQNQGNQQQFNFNFMQGAGQSAANELLRAWINIPDVMTRNQGLACSIYVMRDLDMRGAYRLRQHMESER